jgi:hypothetical protein
MSIEKRVLSDGSLHVAVKGEIGDTFDGVSVAKGAADANKVVIHLGEVKNVTSVGVRNLDEFISAFGKREVVLIHISPAVATQIIMIPGLCAGARIESAKMPFTCPSCASEKSHSVPWQPRAHIEHAPKCGSCGARMELDGIPAQYLPS